MHGAPLFFGPSAHLAADLSEVPHIGASLNIELCLLVAFGARDVHDHHGHHGDAHHATDDVHHGVTAPATAHAATTVGHHECHSDRASHHGQDHQDLHDGFWLRVGHVRR